MLHIAICDDEKLSIAAVRTLLTQLDEPQTIHEFLTAEELLDYAQNAANKLDILICDIVLNDFNGIDLSERIKKLCPATQIIFISAYLQHRIDVYRVAHIYFIPKPVTLELLRDAIEKCKVQLNEKRGAAVIVKIANATRRIALDSIIYLEQRERVCVIHTREETCRVYIKLSEISKQLDERFIRCHQSYIVNIDYVTAKVKGAFGIFGGHNVPISRRYETAAVEQFITGKGRLI